MCLLRVFPLSVSLMLLLAGCAELSEGPYHPEPFANHSYERRADATRGGDPYHADGGSPFRAREAAFSPSFRGAVGYRPNPVVDIRTIADYRRAQDYYIRQFFEMGFTFPAGSTGPHVVESPLVEGAIAQNRPGYIALMGDMQQSDYRLLWSEITKNGFNYIDGVCQDFLRQIYRLRKNTRGLRPLTSNIGFAATGIAGTALAGSPEAGRILAYLAAAFGLGTSIFDIYESAILLGMDYSTVHSLVQVLHGWLREAVTEVGVDSRSEAVHAIQAYLYLCTPQSIEAAVNAKVGTASGAGVLRTLGLGNLIESGGAELSELVYALRASGDAGVSKDRGRMTLTLPSGRN